MNIVTSRPLPAAIAQTDFLATRRGFGPFHVCKAGSRTSHVCTLLEFAKSFLLARGSHVARPLVNSASFAAAPYGRRDMARRVRGFAIC
jgi:hypothetical protein